MDNPSERAANFRERKSEQAAGNTVPFRTRESSPLAQTRSPEAPGTSRALTPDTSKKETADAKNQPKEKQGGTQEQQERALRMQKVRERMQRFSSTHQVGKARNETQSAYLPTMPMTRFVLMLCAAVAFYVMQFLVGAVFISPALLGGGIVGLITADKCSNTLHFSDTVCAVIGGATGAVSAVTIEALDDLSGKTLSGISNGTGELLATIIGFAAFVFFTLWYFFAGIKFFGSPRALKRFGIYAVGELTGMIPFIQLLPASVLSVFFVCLQARVEDKERLAEEKKRLATQAKEEDGRQAREAAIGAARQRQYGEAEFA